MSGVKSIPLYDETKPISCTIDRGEVSTRVELIERMRLNLDRIERGEHGMILRFPNRADIEADLERFAVDEKRCCEFWGFAVEVQADELTLRWDAPPDASDLVDRFLAYFTGDEPLTDLAGLL
jgi:hypothetical protein